MDLKKILCCVVILYLVMLLLEDTTNVVYKHKKSKHILPVIATIPNLNNI